MQEEPLLPGSLAPSDGRLPLAYIYQPSPSAMQSALAGRHPEWVLEFEPWEPQGGRAADGVDGHPRTRSARSIGCAFPDRQSAIEFAKRHGWRYIAQQPPVRSFQIKSYADNFR